MARIGLHLCNPDRDAAGQLIEGDSRLALRQSDTIPPNWRGRIGQGADTEFLVKNNLEREQRRQIPIVPPHLASILKARPAVREQVIIFIEVIG